MATEIIDHRADFATDFPGRSDSGRPPSLECAFENVTGCAHTEPMEQQATPSMAERKKPLALVPKRISTDTVDALRELLAGALAGNVIGVAMVAMYRERELVLITAGEAHRSPIFARGMVAHLDDTLGALARQK